jgi:hypothetical protein
MLGLRRSGEVRLVDGRTAQSDDAAWSCPKHQHDGVGRDCADRTKHAIWRGSGAAVLWGRSGGCCCCIHGQGAVFGHVKKGSRLDEKRTGRCKKNGSGCSWLLGKKGAVGGAGKILGAMEERTQGVGPGRPWLLELLPLRAPSREGGKWGAGCSPAGSKRQGGGRHGGERLLQGSSAMAADGDGSRRPWEGKTPARHGQKQGGRKGVVPATRVPSAMAASCSLRWREGREVPCVGVLLLPWDACCAMEKKTGRLLRRLEKK